MNPRQILRRPDSCSHGGALILAVSMLALVALLLGTVLAMLLSRRAQARRVLVRDLVEADARSAIVSLKTHLKTRIQQSGGIDLSAWNPGESGLSYGSTPADTQPVFQRTLSVSALSSPSASASASMPSPMLACLNAPLVSTQSIRGIWRPVHPSFGSLEADARWVLSTDLRIFQVPLSAFNFYAASPYTALNNAQRDLGRLHVEGDLQADSPATATRPVSCAGELRLGRNGALIVKGLKLTETRAFHGLVPREDSEAQADGWIYQRNTAPPFLVRPATTLELFSKHPLPFVDKERHRLKPQCALQILHSVNESGRDSFVVEGALAQSSEGNLDGLLTATPDSIEVDLSKWPASLQWVPTLWMESDQPRILCVTLKGAECLGGDFSVATDLDICLVGSFNTTPPVRKASILTKGRVVVCR